jgi:outer membrane protein assembly factor BamB
MACVPPVPKPGPERQEAVWSTYLGSPRHDVSATETLNPDPRPEWSVDVGHAVRGAPALGEGVVAVGVSDRVIALIDRTSGQEFWRQRVAGTVHGGPLIDGDRLYAATEATPESKVYALRMRDGKPLWSTAATSVQAPLGFDGSAVYAGGEDGTVLRLDAESGRQMWRRRLSGAVRAAPITTPEGIVIATAADTLYLLDATTGSVKGRLATSGAIVATPTLSDRRLFVATTSGRVMELELPSLNVRWTRTTDDGVYGAMALVGDTLTAIARDGDLWFIPIDAPEQARVLRLEIVSVAGPTPVASGVLVASVSGEILLVDRTDGKILWRAQLDGPIEQPPLVRDRQLVVVAGRGDIHAYR